MYVCCACSAFMYVSLGHTLNNVNSACFIILLYVYGMVLGKQEFSEVRTKIN